MRHVSPVVMEAVGRELVRLASEAHPRPWRVLGSGVVDAHGAVVVEVRGNLAAATFLLDTWGEIVLPLVNGVRDGN